MAGRIITGIEYRLAARFDGRRGIAPDLRPLNGRAAGPGRPVTLPWRDVLRLAGDYWDPTDPAADKAARMRFDRAVAWLDRADYWAAHPRAEATAGDAVEVLDPDPWQPCAPAGPGGARIGPLRRGGPPGADARREGVRGAATDRLCRLERPGMTPWKGPCPNTERAVPQYGKGRAPITGREPGQVPTAWPVRRFGPALPMVLNGYLSGAAPLPLRSGAPRRRNRPHRLAGEAEAPPAEGAAGGPWWPPPAWRPATRYGRPTAPRSLAREKMREDWQHGR